jgi:hypothetical protein
MYVVAKVLEAVGIASLGVGLVQGLVGNVSVEYYTFFGGIGLFLLGVLIEKLFAKRR